MKKRVPDLLDCIAPYFHPYPEDQPLTDGLRNIFAAGPRAAS